MKKILILYTSVGLGHKSIAENIGFYLARAGYEVKTVDIGKVQTGKFEKYVTAIHQFINRCLPFVWGWMYDWGHYIILPFRTFIAGFNYRLTKSFIDEFRPDLVITTQTAASAVVDYLKKKDLYKNLFAVAFSDYHLHPYWLYQNADFYLVNIELQKQQMLRAGIAKEKIFVCGMILKPKMEVDIDAAKTKLGIRSGEKVVLISSGSLGSGIDLTLIEKFNDYNNIRPIVVCGKNQEIYQRLTQRFTKTKVITFGFYQPMDELYAIADIFITKPGGLSVAEALRWGLPILISHQLPGQETYNYNYLVGKGWVMPKSPDTPGQTIKELQSGYFKRQLATNEKIGSLFNGHELMLKAVENYLGQPRQAAITKGL